MSGGKVPTVGLVAVSLAGERTDLAKDLSLNARDNLIQSGLDVAGSCELNLTGDEVMRATVDARNQGADCLIYLIGTWIYAPDVVNAMQQTSLPTIIWGFPEGSSFSSVGANVLHGSLDELGLKHKLVYGMPDDNEALEEIVTFSRASMVRSILRKSRFGLIGGRSIGMYPSTVDPVQVKSVFGIEIEHVDQLLLIEYARETKDEDVLPSNEKILKDYGKINVPNEVMIKSIKVYYALRRIVEERQFDFVGIKCLEEVISNYVSCCLAIALANDEGIVTACQSDINTAIAMKVLNLFTNHPTIFADVNLVDKKQGVARLINCGTMPTTLARSKREVEWGYQYEYMGKARGACPTFCCKPGQVTFGGFSRINGNYVLQIARGEAFHQPKSVLAEVRDIWPQAFIRLDCSPMDFYQNLRSNHIAVGYGNVEKELLELCNLLDIRHIVII